MLMVLAIAGMILLIAFLAIPALQRNARNNERKQDVSLVLSSISQFQLNHSGSFPTTAELGSILSDSKITYYTNSGAITITTVGTNGSGRATTNNTTAEEIKVYNRTRCSGTSSGQPVATGAGFSDAVALYSAETRTGRTPMCQEL